MQRATCLALVAIGWAPSPAGSPSTPAPPYCTSTATGLGPASSRPPSLASPRSRHPPADVRQSPPETTATPALRPPRPARPPPSAVTKRSRNHPHEAQRADHAGSSGITPLTEAPRRLTPPGRCKVRARAGAAARAHARDPRAGPREGPAGQSGCADLAAGMAGLVGGLEQVCVPGDDDLSSDQSGVEGRGVRADGDAAGRDERSLEERLAGLDRDRLRVA